MRLGELSFLGDMRQRLEASAASLAVEQEQTALSEVLRQQGILGEVLQAVERSDGAAQRRMKAEKSRTQRVRKRMG